MSIFILFIARTELFDRSQAIERTLTFSLAGGRMAYLYAEKTSYHYLKGSPIFKEWLKSHWEAILTTYGDEHHLQKEDLVFSTLCQLNGIRVLIFMCLVIECLDAKNYAMFVNHGHSDQEVCPGDHS